MNATIQKSTGAKSRRFAVVGIVLTIGMTPCCAAGLYYYAFWKEHGQIAFNSSEWSLPGEGVSKLQTRRKMIRDIVLRVLPKKTRSEIEAELGPSPTPPEARIAGPPIVFLNELAQNAARARREQAGLDVYADYYYDELPFDWDLAYCIGKCKVPYNPLRFQVEVGSFETLLIRLDASGRFESWFVAGETDWSQIVGEPGNRSFREKR